MHVIDTYNIVIRRTKTFLETHEKKFTLKFSQNQEISPGAESIFWGMIFLNPTKICFSYRVAISTCRVMLQVVRKVSLDSKEHFTYA